MIHFPSSFRYMKMIDIWMIFCFLLPFFEVILHTLVEYCQPDENVATYPSLRYSCYSQFLHCLTFLGKARGEKRHILDPVLSRTRFKFLRSVRPISVKPGVNFAAYEHPGRQQRWKNVVVQRRIDYVARVTVPVVIMSFNIYYWEDAFRNGGLEV